MKKLYFILLFLLSLFFQWRDGGVSVETHTPRALAWGEEDEDEKNEDKDKDKDKDEDKDEDPYDPPGGGTIIIVIGPPRDNGYPPSDEPSGWDYGRGDGNDDSWQLWDPNEPLEPSIKCEGERCPICEKFIQGTITHGSNCPMCPGHEEEKKPCNDIIKNQVIQNYMNDLINGRMAANPNMEHGDLRRADGTWKEKPNSESSVKSQFKEGEKYTHSFHSHPASSGYMIFPSGADLFTLWRTFEGGYMQDASEFVYGIIGTNTSVMIKIKDTTALKNYMSRFEGEDKKDKFERDYDNAIERGKPKPYDDLLHKSAAFCEKMGLEMVASKDGDTGSREQDTDAREWRELDNGELKNIDCE